MAVAILTIAVSLIGAYSSGFFQNPMDIAPNFAGIVPVRKSVFNK
jgi:hypothetical protein